MSNNYIQWSEEYSIPDSAVEWVKRAIGAALDSDTEEEEEWNGEPDHYKAPWRGNDCDEDGCLDFRASVYRIGNGPTKLRINSGECGDLERVAVFFKHLAKLTEDSYVLEYASYSDAMRPGEFGGGVLVVTKDQEAWETTDQMGDRLLAQLRAAK